MKTLIPITMLLLAGCATAPSDKWAHESKTHAQFLQDKVNCQTKKGQAYPPHKGLYESDNERAFINECMQGEGWEQVRTPASAD